MTWAVRFEEVSKQYPSEGTGYASLREDLLGLGRAAAAMIRRRPADRHGRLALDSVSFEVEKGESFAIIGPNGAGKTTSLKLMTQISFPTAGRVRVRGRVAALIEVGSGIHPELTGRENIWLYGRIMGMPRREIARRFDEIVDFAELGHVLDMSVKRYSTGMQLRLGFSIASHLDPDIFVVDEALAVGDAGFQARCVERMMHLVAEGRTLLFVSHNLSAVEAICRRGVFLLDGKVEVLGPTRDALRAYLNWIDTRQQTRLAREGLPRPSSLITIDRISFHDASGHERTAFRTGEEMEIRLAVNTDAPLERPFFSIGISDGRPGSLILCSMLVDGRVPDVLHGRTTMSCRIHRLPLLPRVYQTWCSIRNGYAYGDILDWQIIGAFRVAEGPPGLNGQAAMSHSSTDAPIHAEYEWQWKS
jgi:lipopolysaccharide transport system ATP-binding protein